MYLKVLEIHQRKFKFVNLNFFETWESISDPSTVDCAVGGTRLVVNLIEGQGFGVSCKENKIK